MVNKLKVINFLQDFGCARLDFITFLTKEDLLYHIIVADEENKKGIVKLVNSYPKSLPKADKLILAFPNGEELENIDCEIPFLYTKYPELEILNNYRTE